VEKSKDAGNQQALSFVKLVPTLQCMPQQSSPFSTFNPQMAHMQNFPTPPQLTTPSRSIAGSMLMSRPLHGCNSSTLFTPSFPSSPRLPPAMHSVPLACSQALKSEPLTAAATPLLNSVWNRSQLPFRNDQSPSVHRATIGAPNIQGAGGNVNATWSSGHSLAGSPTRIQNQLDVSMMTVRPRSMWPSLTGSRHPQALDLSRHHQLKTTYAGSARLLSSELVRQLSFLRESAPSWNNKLVSTEAKLDPWSCEALQTWCDVAAEQCHCRSVRCSRQGCF